MANRIFIVGVDSIDDVLAIRTEALEMLRNGGSTATAWSAEGISVSRLQGFPLNRILEETLLFLQMADPDLYGRRITRTSPGYLL